MKSELTNKKMLVAGWIMLVLSVFFFAFVYEMLAPRYYRYRKNQTIMKAYEDVAGLDLSDMDREVYELLTEYENEHLSFIISDEQRNRLYMTQSWDSLITDTDLERWREQYSPEPVIYYQNEDVLRLARLRGIIQQGKAAYYVYIKERSSNIRDYHEIIMPFLCLMEAAGVAAAGLGLWCCYRRFDIQLEREAHKNQDERMQQKMRSDRVERLQKDFVARMTHELKTPLAVISSQVEMLEYVTDHAQQKQYIDSVQEEVERISAMVGNMLDISVVEHQMEHMLQTRLDMRELMEYVAMKYEGIIAKKQIDLECFFEENCIVCGDREYIEQALNNFMMNAVEHTPIQGSMRMTLKKEKRFVRAAVYNEGDQIPPKEQERLWDGYYRKESGQNTASTVPHAGLGLSIVRGAVLMHGGTYGVRNMERGVEFWFALPEEK